MASPRRAGPTRSIFMMTVVDQVSPWLTPSNTLAATIHVQLGPQASRNGTGTATSQPVTSTGLRPTRSEIVPAKRLVAAPPEEFAAGHIPAALSVPLERLDAALARLPRRTQIVAYCRGPYCVLAVQAVERLRARGFQARRLAGGMPEWRLAAVGEH
jgi:hypothetical protein